MPRLIRVFTGRTSHFVGFVMLWLIFTFSACPNNEERSCCPVIFNVGKRCPAHPGAIPRINPCGGCKTEWLDKDGNKVDCHEGKIVTLIAAYIKWATSSEFVSSSILSWQILTAHAQPFRGARGLAFCLKVPLDSLLVWASRGGSGETARMRRLAWTFAARIGDKYQIRLTRSYSLSLLNWYISNILAQHIYIANGTESFYCATNTWAELYDANYCCCFFMSSFPLMFPWR